MDLASLSANQEIEGIDLYIMAEWTLLWMNIFQSGIKLLKLPI